MTRIQLVLLVLLSGALFTTGDIVAREWGKNRASLVLFGLMAVLGTSAYAVMGTLMRSEEFTKVAIWTSITLTSLSCLYGLIVLKDELTWYKIMAIVFALAACYCSTK